ATPGRPTTPETTRGWQSRYVLALVLVDAAAVVLATAVATLLRFGGAGEQVVGSPIQGVSYYVASLVLGLFWLLVLAGRGAYSRPVLGLGPEEYKRVVNGSLLAGGTVAIVCYLGSIDLARGWMAVAFPLGTALLVLGRWVARRRLHDGRGTGRFLHRVLVVGAAEPALDLVRVLHREEYAGYRVVGACLPDPRERLDGDSAIPVVGGLEHVRESLLATGADTVAVVSTQGMSGGYLRRLAWSLEGLGVDLVVAPSLTDVAGPRITVRPLAGLPLLQVDEPRFTGWRRVGKTVFDRCGSLLLLVLGLPVLLGLAAAIKLHDGGPVLFRQIRVGADGRQFAMLKFRSMVVGAESLLPDLRQADEGNGVLFKIRQDPRVTSVGRFMRRWSLDELPQLVNVLTGDMSLVGPRPPLPEEVERYGDDAMRRLLVRPGMTGLWQVSGRSELSWDDSVRLDLYYVENWSFSQDLLILFKTVHAVAKRHGAY
ncbi:MAG TPA: sugar transferase, partial [Jiangellales bacterium]|nr:sugar transferase [Jiangellales bacterium]